jgi:glycosyltransferase involved in cell wall biosynthesis
VRRNSLSNGLARAPDPSAPASGVAPAVSIGVPVYDGEAFLEESLTSLLNQTFTDFEVIISDNASTDATQRICEDFASRDDRVKYFRNQVNKGVTYNWNRTFHLASAPLFKWAAHDDVCGVKFLESCVDVFRREPSVVLCYPEAVRIDENGNESSDRIVNPDISSFNPVTRFSALMGDPFWATGLFGVIRRDVLARTNLLGNYIAHDHVLLAELALRGPFAVANEVAFFHRHHMDKEQHQKTAKSRAQYMYSTGAGRSWPRLKLIGGYLSAIRESNLTAVEKMRCRVIVARWLLVRTKARLFGEAGDG